MSPELVSNINWVQACATSEVPENGGVCVLIHNKQIAIFNFTRSKEWFATQNLCPHRQQMVLSRGITGSVGDVPMVACPFHKKTFSLRSGECLSGDCDSLTIYPIKEDKGILFIGLS
jgi:nitrite reductase (NADH) small subunit